MLELAGAPGPSDILAENIISRFAVEEILDNDDAEIEAFVSGRAIRSPYVALALLEEYDANWSRWNTSRQLAVTAAALSIAKRSGVPAILVCRAEKERANAMRLAGRLTESMAHLSRAEIAARQCADVVGAIGVVEHGKALTLLELSRPHDALRALALAREAYAATRDFVRLERCRVVEASVWYKLGEYVTASVIYERALAAAVDSGDEESAAMSYGNIGHCYVMRGEHRAARGYFAIAADLYESLGMIVPQVRMLRSLGRMDIRESGDIAMMLHAASEAEQHGLIGEWVLTELACVEELLSRDGEADIATQARAVYRRAEALGMRLEAITALSVLTERAKTRSATPAFVREVSEAVDPSFVQEVQAN
jgi:tetratricopeptide (TPR) repeat protein